MMQAWVEPVNVNDVFTNSDAISGDIFWEQIWKF